MTNTPSICYFILRRILNRFVWKLCTTRRFSILFKKTQTVSRIFWDSSRSIPWLKTTLTPSGWNNGKWRETSKTHQIMSHKNWYSLVWSHIRITRGVLSQVMAKHYLERSFCFLLFVFSAAASHKFYLISQYFLRLIDVFITSCRNLLTKIVFLKQFFGLCFHVPPNGYRAFIPST